jgi:hypothetical protein
MNLSTTARDYTVTFDSEPIAETMLSVFTQIVDNNNYNTAHLLGLIEEDCNLTGTLLKKARVVILTRDYYFGFLRFHSAHNTLSQAVNTTNKLSNDHYRSAVILDASGQ